jgi:hypothetical protein
MCEHMTSGNIINEFWSELESIQEYPELADALEEIGRALGRIERIGYTLGFRWHDQRWTEGEEPSDFAARLERWAGKVRDHERHLRSPD